MYFPVFEPYSLQDLTIENSDIDSDITNEVCIICLESNDIIRIKKMFKKYNQCECNYYIHSDCLEKWKNLKNKCPICHSIFYDVEEEKEKDEDEEQYHECYYLNFLELLFIDYQINDRNICLLMIHSCVRCIILIALFTNLVFLVLIFNFIFYIL